MKYLFIIDRPPHHINNRDNIDLIMATAAFDQKVSVLFTGQGVLQLIENKISDQALPSIKLIKAFPLYDISDIFAFKPSVLTFKLPTSTLLPLVNLIDTDMLSTLFTEADKVIKC